MEKEKQEGQVGRERRPILLILLLKQHLDYTKEWEATGNMQKKKSRGDSLTFRASKDSSPSNLRAVSGNFKNNWDYYNVFVQKLLRT